MGPGCFSSTGGEDSIFPWSLPPIPCYLNHLTPHASPSYHLRPTCTTNPVSSLLRYPSVETSPVLNQRKPLGSPQILPFQMLSCRHSLAPFFPKTLLIPHEGGVPGVTLHAWQHSASRVPVAPMAPSRAQNPQAGEATTYSPTTGPAGSDLIKCCLDFKSCFTVYLQGSSRLASRHI